MTQRLKRVRGIAPIPANVPAAKIGRTERFRNPRAPASYAWPAPRSDETGGAGPETGRPHWSGSKPKMTTAQAARETSAGHTDLSPSQAAP